MQLDAIPAASIEGRHDGAEHRYILAKMFWPVKIPYILINTRHVLPHKIKQDAPWGL